MIKIAHRYVLKWKYVKHEKKKMDVREKMKGGNKSDE